jgi:hypothetical protein
VDQRISANTADIFDNVKRNTPLAALPASAAAIFWFLSASGGAADAWLLGHRPLDRPVLFGDADFRAHEHPGFSF